MTRIALPGPIASPRLTRSPAGDMTETARSAEASTVLPFTVAARTTRVSSSHSVSAQGAEAAARGTNATRDARGARRDAARRGCGPKVEGGDDWVS